MFAHGIVVVIVVVVIDVAAGAAASTGTAECNLRYGWMGFNTAARSNAADERIEEKERSIQTVKM